MKSPSYSQLPSDQHRDILLQSVGATQQMCRSHLKKKKKKWLHRISSLKQKDAKFEYLHIYNHMISLEKNSSSEHNAIPSACYSFSA